ncbi:biogenesis of lysosome- organelles complex 1 subunit 2 [Entomortierella lignicola]|nr:biogenesis of lysosome- organelles complex 1 subunit 2 [Entomortierella lignicola]
MSGQPSRTGTPGAQSSTPPPSSLNNPSSTNISQLMSPPTKSVATMALSQPTSTQLQSSSSTTTATPNKSRSTPTPSSSSSSIRAQSLHSSISQSQQHSQQQHPSVFSAAEAAKHLSEEHVARTSQDMFRKIADYVKAEMLATGEEYKLLENMNVLTKERYSELAVAAQELIQEVGKLRTTYSDFEPYLARIDDISQQAETISNIAAELDEYTKSLETRLKRVMK